MSNVKAFSRGVVSQKFMYHLRNQIPNKEINIVHYTLKHKEIRYFIQNLYNHSLFIIMCNSQTLLSGDDGLIVILGPGPVLASPCFLLN